MEMFICCQLIRWVIDRIQVMNTYKILSVISISSLILLVGLTVYILAGKHSIRKVTILAGIGFTLMVCMTVMCSIIYLHYN